MEDKTFELLEKMYVEFSSRFDKVENKLGNVESRLDNVEGRLDNVEGHITRIENEHGQKLDALFDGYKQLHDKQEEHDKRFDRIESKLDNLSLKVISHDSKLEVLEGGRKK